MKRIVFCVDGISSVRDRGINKSARSACRVCVTVAIVAAMLLVMGTARAFAQSSPDTATARRAAATLDSLLRANAHPLSITGGLSGAGAELLFRTARGAQFVAIGERHDIREIPELARLLLDSLIRREGFQHLVTENGSLTLDVAMRTSSITSFIQRYPAALEFNADEDLALYDAASRRLGRRDAIWGVDQEFGALQLLSELRSLTPAARRASLDSLTAVVRIAESKRYNHGGSHWLAVDATPDQFRALRRSLTPVADSRADRILSALEKSASIYEYNRLAGQGQLTGFRANAVREEYMKEQFGVRYRAAVRRGELPKALIKMGSAHLGRGQSPFGPFAFGGFLSELAAANGLGFVNVLVLAHNPPTDSIRPNLWKWPDMRPLAVAAAPEQITLFDLRPLRDYLYAGRLGAAGPDLRRMIYGYDFAVLIGGAHDATESMTP